MFHVQIKAPNFKYNISIVDLISNILVRCGTVTDSDESGFLAEGIQIPTLSICPHAMNIKLQLVFIGSPSNKLYPSKKLVTYPKVLLACDGNLNNWKFFNLTDPPEYQATKIQLSKEKLKFEVSNIFQIFLLSNFISQHFFSFAEHKMVF